MTIYFISGLGADSFIFKNLEFPEGTKLVYLDWINPIRDESLFDYAKRFSDLIDTSEPFSIVGLSMGGMIAVELSKIVKPEKIAIISSASTYREIPLWYRLGGKLSLHKLIPFKLAPVFRRPVYFFMGARKPGTRYLVDRYIDKMNIPLVEWSVDAILNWRNTYRPKNLLHIHGTRDKILPIKNIKPDIEIPNGGHLMLLVRAKEISAILNRFFGLR